MRLRSLFLFTLLLALTALPQAPGRTQAQITPGAVDYIFAETITFRAQIQSSVPVETVSVFFQADGDTRTQVGEATLAEGGEAVYIHDLTTDTLRAFSKITYWFQVWLAGGETLTSERASFDYIDNRFQWLTLQEDLFSVHWYSGDVAFGQSVLDVAQEGFERARNLLILPNPEPVEIYVYASAVEMQAVLNPLGPDWVAGHADPDLGIIVVALPAGPDQRLLMEQRVPHELMHVMLFQSTGPAYQNLPTWLSEGLASITELYPNPDYQILLEGASQKGALLPMASLCASFPQDGSQALLAYAQSSSFTRYLHSAYGTPRLQALITFYANGVACDPGVQAALGSPLEQLERQWRQSAFNENAVLIALARLLPWATLLVAALAAPVLLALSSLRRRSPSRGPNMSSQQR